MFKRPRRFLRLIALSLVVVALSAYIYSHTVWSRYLYTLPRQPDQLSQRIYPRNIHGIVVYQTKSEMESLDELEQGSLAVFFAGLLVLGFEEMRWKKRQGTAS